MRIPGYFCSRDWYDAGCVVAAHRLSLVTFVALRVTEWSWSGLTSRDVRTSTNSPECLRKSAPRSGRSTSANTNVHSYGWLPNLNWMHLLPKVLMMESLAAVRGLEGGLQRRSSEDAGSTLISAPVSTRNCLLHLVSLTKNKLLMLPAPVLTGSRPLCFPPPKNKESHTCTL